MWQFWNGYVIIQIEGLCIARFLKRLSDAGIRISDVRQTGDAAIRCTIPAKRFRSLRKLRHGLPLKIRIVDRGGLPFGLRKLWRRPFLWGGTALLFAAITVLSSRIWIIRIEKTKQADPEEILSLLQERGIYPGAYPEGPILITAANDLSAQVHGASWIGLDREGILLTVRVKESAPESPKKTDRVPSDIVANRDGIVTSIRVMRGQARVKVGDRVKAGDVLISGTVLYHEQSTETAADGTVYAAVDYRTEAELVDRVRESYETGSTEQLRYLRFWNSELFCTDCAFDHYRIESFDAAAENGLLPFSIGIRTAREIGFRERILTDEEAEQYALIEAREQAYAMIPKDAAIINTYGTIQNRNGKRIAVVIVTAEELIGQTEERPHDG
jgi:similar to stage IV sporulation protein